MKTDHTIVLKDGEKILIYANDEREARNLYNRMTESHREVLQVAIRQSEPSDTLLYYP